MNTIIKLREKNKMTQIELAQKLNITQGAVSQWETGETKPKAEILPRLAKALGCTIDDLFKEAENEVS